MKVSVGSKNPIKVEAVKRCFQSFFEDVQVESIAVQTIPQPIGYLETIKYAVSRSLQAISSGDYDYGVGIEAGLVEAPYSITGYMDKHVCAITDKNHRVTIGVSMGFEFPVEVVNSILSGKYNEAEQVIEEISGIKNIGDLVGAIGYLTREKIVRIDLCTQAIISALIPRLNTRHYNVSWPTAEEILYKT